MSLGSMQEEFTIAMARLIVFAYEELGIKIRFGDTYRDSRVHGAFGEKLGYGAAYSVHKQKLAADLNVFIGGDYITDGNHSVWDKLHGRWLLLGGAKRIDGDANHFSFEYQGYR